MPHLALMLVVAGLDQPGHSLVLAAARLAWPGRDIRLRSAPVPADATAAPVLTEDEGVGEVVLFLGPAAAAAVPAALAARDAEGLPRWAVIVPPGAAEAAAHAAGLCHVAPASGEPAVLAGMLRTTLHAHQLQRELLRARGDLVTIARTVAHELRAPLGCALTTAEMLLEELGEEAPAQAPQVRPIIEAAGEAVRLLDRVSQVLRASGQPTAPQDLPMDSVFFRAWDQFETRLQRQGATVTYPENWPVIRGVPAWIETIWSTLLANVVAHAGPAPRVTIGWQPEAAGGCRFSVSDAGTGVPEALRARLFTPFHHLHVHDSVPGLGLPILQRLVALQGGMSGYAPTPGGGATFFFTLPGPTPAAPARSADAADPFLAGAGVTSAATTSGLAAAAVAASTLAEADADADAAPPEEPREQVPTVGVAAGLDRFTRLAARSCRAPVALLPLVAGSRLIFQSAVGLTGPGAVAREVPFRGSLCHEVVTRNEPLVVEDTRTHPLFCEAPVVRELGLVAYLGMPLHSAAGRVLGTLCVLDRRPRAWTATDCANLADLAVLASEELQRQEAARRAPPAADAPLPAAPRPDLPAAPAPPPAVWSEVIDALADHIAVLDATGTIIAVNAAWRQFAVANGYRDSDCGVGTDYLATCDPAKGGAGVPAHPAGGPAHRELREVVEGTRAEWIFEYPCHAPHAPRWFEMRAAQFGTGAARHVVVAHQNITARKQAEQFQREIQSRLSGILALLPAGIYACDEHGRITFCNRHALELWSATDEAGAAAGDRVGDFPLRRLDGSRLAPADSPTLRALQAGEPVRDHLALMVRADGVRLTFNLQVDLLRDEADRINGAITVLQDITARRRSENLVAGQRRALELLVEDAPLAEVLAALVLTVEEESGGRALGAIMLAGPEGRQQVGAAPHLPEACRTALAGLPLLPAAAPDRAAGPADRLDDPAWAALRPVAHAHGLRAAWSLPIIGTAGRLLGTFGCYARDAGELTRAEREMVATLVPTAALAIERRQQAEVVRAHAAQLQLVTENAPICLAQCDRAERFLFVNRAYAARFGRTPADFIGHTLEEMLGPEVRAVLLPHITRVLAGETVRYEAHVPYREAGRTFVSVAYVPEVDAQGTVRGWLAAITDLTERERLMSAMRQLASIVESSDDAIISKDLTGTITSWNAAAERLLGYSAAEMIGQSILRLLPPDRYAEEVDILERIQRGERLAHFETVRRRRDGSLLPLSITVSPMRDEHGRVVGASKIARDITGTKRTAAVLARRARLLELLNRVAGRLVAERDVRTIAQEITEAGREACGASWGCFSYRLAGQDEALCWFAGADPERFAATGLPLDPAGCRAGAAGRDQPIPPPAVRRAPPLLFRSSLMVPLCTRSGATMGTLWLGHPEVNTFSEDSETIVSALAAQAVIAIENAQLYAALALELEEQRRIRDTLESNERQLRLITDHALVYICHLGRDYRYLFANRAYAQRYQCRAEDLVGRHLRDVVGESAFGDVLPMLDAALAGERVQFERELAYSTLGSRWVHSVFEPERTATGEVVGFIAVITDITERKRVELELAQARDRAIAASRAKDEFLAALSHELRTPLNPVLLLASEAAENPDLPASVRQDFATIRQNVELEARLIDDLLDLTRITRDKLSLSPAAHDLREIVADALATVRAEVREKQLQLDLAPAAGPLPVWGDAVRLQQVLWNILKNAVKFTPRGGRITVTSALDATGQRAVVIVRDTGIGMTPAELERIFEAFAQGDHAAAGGSHRFGGLGLGLAISRKIAELHAGSISATSPGPDQGTTLRFELPVQTPALEEEDVHPAAPVPVEATVGVALPGADRRVLLVEDHEATRTALARLLTRRGFTVVPADSIAAARAAAAVQSFALVISDIGLPDGSGYDLMAQLRAEHGLTGIALTGYGMDHDLARSEAAGFRLHLTKPVRVEALQAALAGLLAEPPGGA